jgi:hypothetical protein
MLNTSTATTEKNYTIKMSSGNGPVLTESQTHSQSEIIDRAKEVLSKELGLDLCDYADLEIKLIQEGDGDKSYYVDKSGRTVQFTPEMQFKAAIAVLNSQEQHFEAIPV